MSVRLRGMTWEHERGYGSVIAAAAEYRNLHPEVEIEWTYRSLQAFADQPLEEIAGEMDLLVIDHPHVAGAASAGLLLPLSGAGHDDDLRLLAAEGVGPSHASYTWQGQQWGLATDAAVQVAAYRPDLLESPPGNWHEVLDLARQGRVLWPYKPVDAYSSLITVASGNGEEPMRQPNRFLSYDALAGAMTLLEELASLVPPSNSTANPIDVADALAAGDRYAYSPLLFGYSNYARAGYRQDRLRYIDIPSSRRGVAGALLGGAGVVVTASSKNASAAVDHAFWLASSHVQEGVYYDGGGQPGNSAAWNSDRTNADSLDFFRGTRATIEGAYLRPKAVRYIEFQNQATRIIHRALIQRGNVLELSRRLDDCVAQYLEVGYEDA